MRTAGPHYSRGSWECGAPSAVTLLCTRSPPMTCVCHAFFCRIQSRVNRNRAFFSSVIRWERTVLYSECVMSTARGAAGRLCRRINNQSLTLLLELQGLWRSCGVRGHGQLSPSHQYTSSWRFCATYTIKDLPSLLIKPRISVSAFTMSS